MSNKSPTRPWFEKRTTEVFRLDGSSGTIYLVEEGTTKVPATQFRGLNGQSEPEDQATAETNMSVGKTRRQTDKRDSRRKQHLCIASQHTVMLAYLWA